MPQLSPPIEFQLYIKKIFIFFCSHIDHEFIGVSVVTAGWGWMDERDASSMATKLQAVNMTTIPNEECFEATKFPITDNMLCANDPGKSTCIGDSGGN